MCVFNVRKYGDKYYLIDCCSCNVVVDIVEFWYIKMVIDKNIVYWNIY